MRGAVLTPYALAPSDFRGCCRGCVASALGSKGPKLVSRVSWPRRLFFRAVALSE